MRTIDDMIRQEVHYCVSGLVSTLAKGFGTTLNPQHPIEGATEIYALWSQAFDLAAPVDDWEEAAIQDGWKHVGNESDRAMLFTKEPDNPNADIVHACTWGELCELEGLEPYQREVFEHWLVSDWFAEKLIQHGEKVDTDFAGMTIWARTTTGQAISADGVVQRIYREVMK